MSMVIVYRHHVYRQFMLKVLLKQHETLFVGFHQ